MQAVPEIAVHLVLVNGTPFGGPDPFAAGLTLPAPLFEPPLCSNFYIYLPAINPASPVHSRPYDCHDVRLPGICFGVKLTQI